LRRKYDFIQNQSGQPYSATDFDITVGPGTLGEVYNPKPVGNATGTLGWYYSTSNNLEPATPTTQFPYSRSYTPPGPKVSFYDQKLNMLDGNHGHPFLV
jgi:hypothetical protein